MADSKKPEVQPADEAGLEPKTTSSAPIPSTNRKTKAPSFVFVDYVGGRMSPSPPSTTPDLDPAVERRRARAAKRFGTRLRPHEIAPLVADPNDTDGKSLGAPITLRSGLNVVDAKAWAVNAPPTKAGEKPATEIAKRVAGRQIVVLEALPTSAEGIIELCERTMCPDALEVLRLHERGRRGGKDGEHARTTVIEAIDHRIATVNRRSKGPSSGPRLGADQVKRRHARLRAS